MALRQMTQQYYHVIRKASRPELPCQVQGARCDAGEVAVAVPTREEGGSVGRFHPPPPKAPPKPPLKNMLKSSSGSTSP